MPVTQPYFVNLPKPPARVLELLDRAVVTAVEGALLSVGQDVVSAGALDIRIVDWAELGSFALGGAFLSLLINLGRGIRSRST